MNFIFNTILTDHEHSLFAFAKHLQLKGTVQKRQNVNIGHHSPSFHFKPIWPVFCYRECCGETKQFWPQSTFWQPNSQNTIFYVSQKQQSHLGTTWGRVNDNFHFWVNFPNNICFFTDLEAADHLLCDSIGLTRSGRSRSIWKETNISLRHV